MLVVRSPLSPPSLGGIRLVCRNAVFDLNQRRMGSPPGLGDIGGDTSTLKLTDELKRRSCVENNENHSIR